MSDLPLLPVRVLHSEPALGKVRALAISSDGAVLWAGTDSGVVLELGVCEGKPLRRFHAHKGGVNCVDLHGGHAATGGNDGIVRVWDRTTLACRLTLKAPGRSVYSVDIGRTEPCRVSALTFRGGVAEWDINGRTTKEPCFLGARAVEDIHHGAWPLSDGRRLVAVLDGEIRLGEVGSQSPQETISLPLAMAPLARLWRHERLYVVGRLPHRRHALLSLDLATKVFAGCWLLPYGVASMECADGVLYAGGNGRLFAIDLPRS